MKKCYRQALRTQGIPFPLSAVEPIENDGGALLREALREAQEQAIANGTANMSLEEITDIINDVRQQNRGQ